MVSISSSSSGTGERYNALWDTRNIYIEVLEWQLFTPSIFLSHHTCKLEFFKVALVHVICNHHNIFFITLTLNLNVRDVSQCAVDHCPDITRSSSI